MITMRIAVRYLIVLVGIVAAVVILRSLDPDSPRSRTMNDAEVYSRVIKNLERKSAQTIAIVSDTRTLRWTPSFQNVLDRVPSEYKGLAKTLLSERNETMSLRELLESSITFIERDSLLGPRRRTYDDTGDFVEFSHIVYDDTQKRAVVFRWYVCGRLCADSGVVLLEWDKDRWWIRDFVMHSIT